MFPVGGRTGSETQPVPIGTGAYFHTPPTTSSVLPAGSAVATFHVTLDKSPAKTGLDLEPLIVRTPKQASSYTSASSSRNSTVKSQFTSVSHPRSFKAKLTSERNTMLSFLLRPQIGDFGTSRWSQHTNSTGLATYTTKANQSTQMSLAWSAPEVGSMFALPTGDGFRQEKN